MTRVPHAPSEHVAATIGRILELSAPDLEKAEALVEVATDLLRKPKSPQELWDALSYFDRAVDLAAGDRLGVARARAGRASALRRLPGADIEPLEAARADFEAALTGLREGGGPEELAEVQMSLGLVLQTLAAAGRASLPKAVEHYQGALQVFRRETHPREYATLHNNLATAYLSMRLAPDRDKMREALAVQSFQEALKVVTLVDDPTEYAMLQNNLGNALQAVQSSHRIANLYRAVEAYDEALRVRTSHDMPLEYANTISNKANALMNLPDDPEHPEAGNPRNLRRAADLLAEAHALFEQNGVPDRAAMVGVLLEDLLRELKGLPS